MVAGGGIATDVGGVPLQQDGLQAGAQVAGQLAPHTEGGVPIIIGGAGGGVLQHAGLQAGAHPAAQLVPHVGGGGGGGRLQQDGAQAGAQAGAQFIPQEGAAGITMGGGAQHEGAHVGAHEAGQFPPHVGLGCAIGASGIKGRFFMQQAGVQLGAQTCEHGEGHVRTGGGGIIGPT